MLERINNLKRLDKCDIEWKTLYNNEKHELENICLDGMKNVIETTNYFRHVIENNTLHGIYNEDVEKFNKIKVQYDLNNEFIALLDVLLKKYKYLLKGLRRNVKSVIKDHKKEFNRYEELYNIKVNDTVKNTVNDTVENTVNDTVENTVNNTVENTTKKQIEDRKEVKRMDIKKANKVRQGKHIKKHEFFKERINHLRHKNVCLTRKIEWLKTLDINSNILNEYILNNLKNSHHTNECLIQMYIQDLNCIYHEL